MTTVSTVYRTRDGVVDLFAGPGGWDTGLAMIGVTDVLGIEWDKAACDTAQAAGHARLQADIAALDPLEVCGTGLDGLIASPPCQGFSMAGKGKGRKDTPLIMAAVENIASGRTPAAELDTLRSVAEDERSALVLEPLRWALDVEPDWLAWEQVPAVLPLWEACAEVLRADGYNVWCGNVQAEQYGVPQTRKRAILIASRSREVARPTPTHSRYHPRSPEKLDEGVAKWVSMGEALGGLPPSVRGMLSAGGNNTAGQRERPPSITGKGTAYWQLRSNYGTGGDPSARGVRTLGQPAPTVTSKIDRNKWVYRSTPMVNSAQRELDQPAPTIMRGHETPQWVSPDEAVRVTVQEAAVLQSFPPDYPWQGSKTAQYRQVGDAVPPLLAAHVLASLGVGSLRVEGVA